MFEINISYAVHHLKRAKIQKSGNLNKKYVKSEVILRIFAEILK